MFILTAVVVVVAFLVFAAGVLEAWQRWTSAAATLFRRAATARPRSGVRWFAPAVGAGSAMVAATWRAFRWVASRRRSRRVRTPRNESNLNGYLQNAPAPEVIYLRQDGTVWRIPLGRRRSPSA